MSTIPIVGQEPEGAACPRCHKRPFVHDMTVNQFPNGIIAAVNYCHDCGHIIGTFMCGAVEPKPAGPRLVS